MTTCRVVIADDHPLFRDALRRAVAPSLGAAAIIEADSFDSLRRKLESASDVDLLLLDLNLPGMHGLSGLLFVRAEFPAVPVAIISAEERLPVVRRALDLGALGYIPKSSAATEIRSAVAALLSGETWLPSRLALDRPPAENDLDRRLASLTPQQLRVLMMLRDGRLNKQIAHELDVSEATAKAHVSAVLQKLNVDNRTQAAMVAQQLAELEKEGS